MKLFLSIILMVLSLSVYAGDYKETEQLLDTDKTIIGETVHYPGGMKADIKSMVVVMKPGEKTAVHKHGVPLYAYMLSGTLEVDYGSHGKNVYRKGDNFMEAMDQFHQGVNIGSDEVRILAVFMGGNGQPIVINE
ncbi:MAG: cupin domain-containing protein [Denitrovibrio sp.]|nr:MAG: cupin domain-containing protein [Denitrovibrio sp.]